jgi:beta-N-acetylhexosaminidase
LYTPTVPVTTPTVFPTNVPRFKVSDTLPLMTGVIYDRNRNPVPDGTLVRFLFTKGGEGGTVEQIETNTQKGVARSSYRIVDSGLLEIRVVSGSAVSSQILQLDINQGEYAAITAIAPTSIVITATPQVSQTPVSPSQIATLDGGQASQIPPTASDWFLSMGLIWGCGMGFFISTQTKIGAVGGTNGIYCCDRWIVCVYLDSPKFA